MRLLNRSPVEFFSFALLVVAAVTALLIFIADSFGFLDIEWRAAIPKMTLAAVGLALGAIAAERVSHLLPIREMLSRVIEANDLGNRYLRETAMVVDELAETVQMADKVIMTTGAKSFDPAYLRLIAARAKSGAVKYYRLLTGDHMTHALHLHLRELLRCDNVQIRWNRSEKYGTFLVTEDRVVHVLPSAGEREFAGLMLLGSIYAGDHREYFTKIFYPSTRVGTERALERLCEDEGQKDHARRRSQLEEDLSALAADG